MAGPEDPRGPAWCKADAQRLQGTAAHQQAVQVTAVLMQNVKASAQCSTVQSAPWVLHRSGRLLSVAEQCC